MLKGKMKLHLFTPAFVLTAFILCTVSLNAQTLVVWQKNGKKAYYSLDERPKTTFTATDLVITTHLVTVNYPLSNVLRYTYETATGIDDIHNNKGFSMSEDGSEVILHNVAKGTKVSVYSVDGKLLEQRTSGGETAMTISFLRRRSGVYVVKHDDVSYKIVRP